MFDEIRFRLGMCSFHSFFFPLHVVINLTMGREYFNFGTLYKGDQSLSYEALGTLQINEHIMYFAI